MHVSRTYAYFKGRTVPRCGNVPELSGICLDNVEWVQVSGALESALGASALGQPLSRARLRRPLGALLSGASPPSSQVHVRRSLWSLN